MYGHPSRRNRIIKSAVKHGKRMGKAALAGATALASRAVFGNRKSRNAAKHTVKNVLKRLPYGKKLADRDFLQQDIGAGGELTKNQVTCDLSKHMSKLKMTEKLVSSNKQEQIFRFSGISPFMNTSASGANVSTGSGNTAAGLTGGGYFPLVNIQNTSTGNVFVVPPLHVYDITSVNNFEQGGYVPYAPGFSFQFVGASNGTNIKPTGLNCFNLYGQSNNGVALTAPTWQNESTTGQTSSPSPLRRDMLDYVHAKFMCYGSAQMATEYKIELIQLKDDFTAPDFIFNNTLTSTGDYGANAIAFWESYAAHSTKHPIASVNPLWRKHCKVLKTVSFTLQPRLTVESDAAVGHAKQVNMFIKLKKLCSYDWLQYVQDQGMETAGAYALDNSLGLQTFLEPKKRIYLTIQATNNTPVTYGTAGSVNFTPSYDMILRTKHVQLQ